MNVTIQQDTSRTEQVSTKLIDLLYKTALNNENVYLSGRVKATGIHQRAYDYLNNKEMFPELYLEKEFMYLSFEDDNMEQLAVDLYSKDGVGVTLKDMEEAEYNSNFNNSSYFLDNGVEHIDLRWCSFVKANGYNQNIRIVAKTAIIGKARLNLAYSNLIEKIDRIIFHTTIYWQIQGNSNNASTGRINIGTLGVLNADGMSDYSFRYCHIDKLYIGNETPPSYKAGTYSLITNCDVIYVPVGSLEVYKSATNGWSGGNFVEYDFDADPDGIFTEIYEVWTREGDRK